MLDYTTLLRCMQQIRSALRSGNREILAAQLDTLDMMVGPQKMLDIYGRLLLEESASVRRRTTHTSTSISQQTSH
jgi:hypothetical protein